MVRNQEFDKIPYPNISFIHNKCLDWMMPALNIPNEGLKSLPLGFDKKLSGFAILLSMGFKRIVWDVPDLVENYHNCIFLVFCPKKEILWSDKWRIFYEFLKKLSNFKGIIDLDVGLMVMIFTLDIKGQEVLRNLKRGTYSKISESIAREYYVGIKDGRSFQKNEFLIVKKSENYRLLLEELLNCSINPNWEYCEKPVESEEIFKYKNKI